MEWDKILLVNRQSYAMLITSDRLGSDGFRPLINNSFTNVWRNHEVARFCYTVVLKLFFVLINYWINVAAPNPQSIFIFSSHFVAACVVIAVRMITYITLDLGV